MAPNSGDGRTRRATPLGSVSASRAVYVISVAAELAGMHPQTLRVYERRGLVEPSRTEGGIRRYSEHDIAQLRRIQELVESGLNLEGVRRVLALEAELAALRRELAEVRAEARDLLERTHRQYRRDLVPFEQGPLVLWPTAGGRRRPPDAPAPGAPTPGTRR